MIPAPGLFGRVPFCWVGAKRKVFKVARTVPVRIVFRLAVAERLGVRWQRGKGQALDLGDTAFAGARGGDE
ncbi:hypothetical protein GCM10023213_18370 [Prosthecobacter algae]|uniref:Uncharacterized protein n=1 Tax=Prosthecobacter algae TaxID=1144682 RepID=A0ABP9P162_9BACT